MAPQTKGKRIRKAAATVAEYLVFVDADTRIEPALLTRALHLLRDERCFGVGAVVRFEGETSAVGRLAIDLSIDEGTPTSVRLWFASPLNPPSIQRPNPDGNYMMMWSPGKPF
ncbi:hypothetical protein JWG42_09105 [Desulfoprunum benzoelyticum]|uniref:Cellulose synthase/poly-beta-1,6-N-acetylglucosamine synthase-like glycosyltransferase n=1 Tax=Desulfoprunum benzoelyticum TaxID=1506996 RepID=A0A840UWX2_9BACT|nr:hypothetical protein [Desulfoprunum benzoelyticum]MBB5347934.1 cellulose synthase/poly-beta-1,6-N-acetylglucosamine synthase-like glycosyltransferase [Desulfoprunum benzoelyticum]MBM9530309.1 hypothetical protein [Desulfoprunum benzoelyticum]